jgi:hypothetical protein
MFKSIIAATAIALTATTAMASETIVCSLKDFQATVNGKVSFGEPGDYILSDKPMVLNIPADAENNKWSSTDKHGITDFNSFNKEKLQHNLVLIYTNKNGNFVAVNAVKSCIKLG